MGSRGPVPKRSTQRRRLNSPDVQVAEGASYIEPPAAAETWHPIAARWYESLADSGQSSFYEPSDWAVAYLLAESISRDLSEQVVGTTEKGEILYAVIPLKGASLAAILKAMSLLLVTEGDRRRVQLELQRGTGADPDEEKADATVTDIMSRLGAS